MEKYLVKVDYHCPNVATGGQWVVVESEKEPELKIIKKDKDYKLPPHNCKKYEYSQICEEDETCFWQQILEVKSFSEEEAKRLNARSLEVRCKV